MFAICWAWINFTWFASAYDTDDWFFRIATMVEMVGVIVLALGLPTVFHAIDSGEGLGNGVVVAGYVVMRLAPIALWLRVAKQDERRRPTALTYAVVVFVAQVGWVAVAVINPPLGVVALVIGVGVVIEAGGVYVSVMKRSVTGTRQPSWSRRSVPRLHLADACATIRPPPPVYPMQLEGLWIRRRRRGSPCMSPLGAIRCGAPRT